MVISDEPPFLFVHIRKTAGTSFSEALKPEGKKQHRLCPPSGHPHETVSGFVQRQGVDVFRRFKSFAVVRHPLRRFVSQYQFMRMRAETKIPQMKDITSISQYIDAIKRNDEVTVVLKAGNKIETHGGVAMPQHQYVSLGDTAVAVGRIIRFEELSREWPSLCEWIGLPFRELPAKNVSAPLEIDDRRAVERFVEDYYREDYERFGYS